VKQVGSTRDAILYRLRSQGRTQATTLALELQLTEMAIRRHMHELAKQGYIKIISIKQSKGRPHHAYELTAKAEELFPSNYQMLTVDLLNELEEDPTTSPLIEGMFQGRKHKLLARYQPNMSNKSLVEKIEALVAIQNAGGYMAEAEFTDDRYYIREYNCPIRRVADRFDHACQCELELFRELLGVPVERTECIAKGGRKCNYQINTSI